MSKKILIAVSFASLVIIAVGFVWLNNSGDNASNATLTSSQDNSGDGPTVSTAENGQKGLYVDYSEQALSEVTGQRVLFFHAPWCPQCRAIEEDIEQQGVPAGYTILKVDYDSNQELRQKYGVRLQTTFVAVDEEGQKLSDYVAYNEPTLEAVQRDFLQ